MCNVAFSFLRKQKCKHIYWYIKRRKVWAKHKNIDSVTRYLTH